MGAESEAGERTSGCDRADDCFVEALEQDRLHQVHVKPCFTSLPSVVILSVSGDGDEARTLGAVSLAQPPRYLITVHDRQPEIEQYDVRVELLDGRQCSGSVVDYARLMPHLGESKS